MRVLITGCAGFIGFHLAKKLIEEKNYVIGLDNLNNYYDVQLKVERLKILKKNKYFKFFKLDITDLKKLDKIFVTNNIFVTTNSIIFNFTIIIFVILYKLIICHSYETIFI